MYAPGFADFHPSSRSKTASASRRSCTARLPRSIRCSPLPSYSEQHQVAEIGWAIHPDHSGKGYATEASCVVLAMACRTGGPQGCRLRRLSQPSFGTACRTPGHAARRSHEGEQVHTGREEKRARLLTASSRMDERADRSSIKPPEGMRIGPSGGCPRSSSTAVFVRRNSRVRQVRTIRGNQ